MATRSGKTTKAHAAKDKPRRDRRKGGDKPRIAPPASLGSSPDAEPRAYPDAEHEPLRDDELDDGVEGQDDDREHTGIER